jgi:hypothetical protein
MNKMDPADLLAAAAPRLSATAKRAHLDQLQAEMQRPAEPSRAPDLRWWGRRTAISVGLVGFLGVGAGAAAAFIQWAEPTVFDTVRCYAASEPADLEHSKQAGAFHDSTLITGGLESLQTDETALRAVEVCAESWRRGSLSQTPPRLPELDPWYVDLEGPKPADRDVPNLVACVLDPGMVGVFPDTTCTTLGLPELKWIDK